jgi:hypothetical protein
MIAHAMHRLQRPEPSAAPPLMGQATTGAVIAESLCRGWHLRFRNDWRRWAGHDDRGALVPQKPRAGRLGGH